MKIPINLSSEPFRRDRPLLVAGGTAAVVLAALLGVLVFLFVSERNRVRETRVAVQRLDAEARTISAEQARLEQVLRQPANAEVLERSLLLNTLVERKSISWTRIFADLEKVTPNTVRLVQVRLPQINTRNEVSLDMTVGSQEPTPVIDFLKHLSASPLFGPVTMHSSVPPSQNQPLFLYRVSVDYAQKL